MPGATRFTNSRIGEKIFFFASIVFFLMVLVTPGIVEAERYPWSNEPDSFEYDDSKDKKWVESRVAPPPFPEDRNLLPIPLPASDNVKAYIDSASFSRADDRVIRYTLVVESPSGARSVFYDGMRCETREYKIYAIGTAERTFTEIKEAKWRPVPVLTQNAFRHHLYRDYLCNPLATVRSSEDLTRLFQQRP